MNPLGVISSGWNKEYFVSRVFQCLYIESLHKAKNLQTTATYRKLHWLIKICKLPGKSVQELYMVCTSLSLSHTLIVNQNWYWYCYILLKEQLNVESLTIKFDWDCAVPSYNVVTLRFAFDRVCPRCRDGVGSNRENGIVFIIWLVQNYQCKRALWK